jgi:HJR/Mrr/RecB family endonuclease
VRLTTHADTRKASQLTAYISGGSDADTGLAGIGVVIEHADGRKVRIAKRIGRQDNDVSEYVALLEALQYASSQKANALRVYSESEPVVRQMTGEYAVLTPHLYSLNWTCRRLARSLDFSIVLVPREDNIEAINLGGEAVQTELGGNPSDADEVGTPLYRLPPEVLPSARIAFNSVNEKLVRYLASHPGRLFDLTPRRFEELVAELFRDQGFEVLLTPQSRDGGFDIKAIIRDSMGIPLLYSVECKLYRPERPVGVEVVRSLYGSASVVGATCGVVATTSRFTRDAQEFASKVKYRLSLRDYNDVVAWLAQYGERKRQ